VLLAILIPKTGTIFGYIKLALVSYITLIVTFYLHTRVAPIARSKHQICIATRTTESFWTQFALVFDIKYLIFLLKIGIYWTFFTVISIVIWINSQNLAVNTSAYYRALINIRKIFEILRSVGAIKWRPVTCKSVIIILN
jgi:hypothetical protein